MIETGDEELLMTDLSAKCADRRVNVFPDQTALATPPACGAALDDKPTLPSPRHGIGRRGAMIHGAITMLSVCTVLLTVGTAKAQLIKHFDRTFGGTGNEYSSGCISILVATADGGALVGSTSLSGAGADKTEPSRGGRDYWVVKTDAYGNKQWDRTFGGSNDERLWDALQTPDGGFIVVGNSFSNQDGDKTQPSRGSSDLWVIRLDSLGNKVWDKTIGGPGTEDGGNIVATSDGAYLVWGWGGAGIGGEKTHDTFGGYNGYDYWVVKIDANGNKIWDQVFGGSGVESSREGILLSNGTFVIGGFSESDASGNKTSATRGGYDYWVVAIDTDGNKLWDQAYGGTGSDRAQSMVATSDGGFAIAGSSESGVGGDKSEPSRGGSDLWIVKADANGNKQWDRTLGTATSEDRYRVGVVQTADGGFLTGTDSAGGISGDRTERSRGSADYWLVRLDNSGTKLWDKALGGSKGELLTKIARTLDGGYFLGGLSDSDISFEKSEPSRGLADLWLVKAFELSTLPPSVSGTTYVDANADCSYDPMVDSPLANRLIEATPGPFFAQSDNDGQFALRLPRGDYNVSQAGLAYSPFAQTCPGPPGTLPVTAVSGSITPVGAFGNDAPTNGTIETTVVTIPPPPLTSPCWGQSTQECVNFVNGLPGLTSPDYIITINGGGSGAYVTGATASTGPQTNCNCTPTWDMNTNTVTCIAPALAAGSTCTICVTVYVPTPPGVPPANQSITVTSSVSGNIQGQPHVVQNVSDPIPIQCAFDPNDRTLLHPGACGAARLIPNGKPLVFRTRFQNLGNAPAHNVVVDETLDDALDPATFKLLGSNYGVTRFEIFPSNRLIVSFIGIELPAEQSDPLGSVGTFLYSIRPKANTPTPRPIQSRAAIFFDLNEPVITNETLNTLVDTLPPVSFTAPPTMCITDPPVTLSGGLPTGGSYSGDGVMGEIFDPAVAGVGPHSIQYSYTASVTDRGYALNTVGAFAPLPGSGTPFSLGDDQISAPLPIGFPFNFYGNDYSELYVSSNGFITFNTASAQGCCIGGNLPGKQNNPSNLIAFAWDDLYAPGSGTFDSFTTGVAPNRIFVLNATNVATCCDSTPKVTSQVLLYEDTNMIEIHTTKAASLNGMTMGIEDNGGLFTTVVPGRNSAIYSITNDFVQFIPPASTTFCSDTEAQTIVVNPLPTASIVASGPTTLCSEDSVTLTASGGTSYAWSTGSTDAAVAVTSPGTYSVLVTDTNGCAAMAEFVVSGVNPDALGLPCVINEPGVCAAGKTACGGGEIICIPNVQASAEVCDGLDNDCDGQVDEDAECVGMGGAGGSNSSGGTGGLGGSAGNAGSSGSAGNAGSSGSAGNAGSGGAGSSSSSNGSGGLGSSSSSGSTGGSGGSNESDDDTPSGSSCLCAAPGSPTTNTQWPLVGLFMAMMGWRRRAKAMHESASHIERRRGRN